MGYSLPGSSIHGIFQARIPDWVAISFSRRSSRPWDWTWVSQHCRQTLHCLSHQGSSKSTLKYLLCSSAAEPSLSLLTPQLLLTWIIPKACDFCVCFLESSGWLHREGFYFTYAILTLLYSLQLPTWFGPDYIYYLFPWYLPSMFIEFYPTSLKFFSLFLHKTVLSPPYL